MGDSYRDFLIVKKLTYGTHGILFYYYYKIIYQKYIEYLALIPTHKKMTTIFCQCLYIHLVSFYVLEIQARNMRFLLGLFNNQKVDLWNSWNLILILSQ